MKPAGYSDLKAATHSDLKAATHSDLKAAGVGSPSGSLG
jgi:hypothetical protein